MSAIAPHLPRSPDVYMPQYGGYDPLGVAHGIAVAGNPNVWLIADEKLFLFYDDDRRDKFAAGSGSCHRTCRPKVAGRTAWAYPVIG